MSVFPRVYAQSVLVTPNSMTLSSYPYSSRKALQRIPLITATTTTTTHTSLADSYSHSIQSPVSSHPSNILETLSKLDSQPTNQTASPRAEPSPPARIPCASDTDPPTSTHQTQNLGVTSRNSHATVTVCSTRQRVIRRKKWHGQDGGGGDRVYIRVPPRVELARKQKVRLTELSTVH
ncbi:hypothetical protein K491DRAFT_452196 [Lophiostoma macrostomum CBS 122681]|uniref:Uncharacterized protein n=1 Tax=Lophiostoma macrostomum CBS 122681 TaxID=1314788 RepID=A0A6A6TMT7_9PLEO|nr:hypothetical protein K491DRAFT_452196 [Lophiostoma macrostomum CBS 122681]